MMRKIISVLMAIMILCSVAGAVFAHEVPEEREDCTIELKLQYDGKPISGGTLTAIRVGTVAEDDGNYFFAREKDGTALEAVDTAAAVETLVKFYEDNRGSYDFAVKTVDVKDGTAKFTGLSTGLYLIVQEKPAAGYSKINPFLIGVPELVDGSYRYEVSAEIKSELERAPATEPPTAPTKEPDDKLPQTGQLNWPIPILVVSGLFLFAAGCLLRADRKKEGHES